MIAVTGASGFIGAHAIRALLGAGHRVLAVSRSPVQIKDVNIEWLRGRPDDDAVLERLVDAAAVLHLSAQTSLSAADNAPLLDLEVNVGATLRLLEVLRRAGQKATLIFASTATVLGLSDELPANESIAVHPETLYDIHKLTSELHVRHYVERGWLGDGASLRFGNVYGGGLGRSAADRCIINRMVCRALAGEDLAVYGGGVFIRDYIHVDDICAALTAALTPRERLGGRSFFVASGEGTPLADAFRIVAEEAGRATGRTVAVKTVDPPYDVRPIDRRDFIANTSAFQAVTGWRPRVELRDGIRRTVDYFARTETRGTTTV